MTTSMRRLTMVVITFAMFLLAAVAFAAGPVKKHEHKSGHALLGANLKTDGTKQIERHGKHSVSADVKGGKIAGFHVQHDTKGSVPVKKYKTHRKMALLDGARSDSAPVDTQLQADLGTEWVAYAYVDDDGNEEYYWFAYEEILDGDTGAIDYVPLN